MFGSFERGQRTSREGASPGRVDALSFGSRALSLFFAFLRGRKLRPSLSFCRKPRSFLPLRLFDKRREVASCVNQAAAPSRKVRNSGSTGPSFDFTPSFGSFKTALSRPLLL